MVVYVTRMRSRALYLLLLFRRQSFADLSPKRLQLPDARVAFLWRALMQLAVL